MSNLFRGRNAHSFCLMVGLYVLLAGACTSDLAAFETTTIAYQSSPIQHNPIGRRGLDGDYVAWVEQNGANSVLKWRNLVTQDQGVVYSSPYSIYDPNIGGSRIVFGTYRVQSGSVDVMLFDIAAQQLTTILDGPWLESRPTLDGDWVVYNDYRNQNQTLSVDVYALNLNTMVSQPVIQEAGADYLTESVGGRAVIYSYGAHLARIKDLDTGEVVDMGPSPSAWSRSDGETIVWHSDEGRPSFQTAIYGRNIDTLEYLQGLPQDDIIREMPDISTNYVVWSQQSPRGDFDIYGLDRMTGAIFPISTTEADERSPVVDGQTVVWSAREEGSPNFLSIYAATIPEPATLTLLLVGGLMGCQQRRGQRPLN